MTKATRNTGGSEGTSGAGAAERAPAKRGGRRPPGSDFDPATRPEGGPTLATAEQRQFHATHFTADPRGAGRSGAPPGGRRRKVRGGTPPAPSRQDEPVAQPKRRGGTGPK
jgi:hypothetical protein